MYLPDWLRYMPIVRRLVDWRRMRNVGRQIGHLDEGRLRDLRDRLDELAGKLRDLGLELGNVAEEYFGTEAEKVYLLRDVHEHVWRAYDLLLCEFCYFLAMASGWEGRAKASRKWYFSSSD
ncbi:MAG: hypothetical protein BA066_06715 [Candidatus Korarchaeota archaeon NZ13-K]|nr:MAG: hypothetical protein BA066_06715 [Candidatus Korarchaeota archaeon NZ13-K]